MGWSSSSRAIEAALEGLGLSDPDSQVAVHYGVAGNFQPIPGRRNVLFTMWESVWQTDFEVMPVVRERHPDLVLVPCQWNADLLLERDPSCPVEVVPLGFDPGVFQYRRRKWRRRDNSRFRLLYLGAPNYRKYSLTREVYVSLRMMREKLLLAGIDLEIYWKLTGACAPDAVRSVLSSGLAEEIEPGLYRGDDWWVDNRLLSPAETAALYHSAHLFLALHTGEGFGLNSLEAMATGLPLVVTNHSGTTQFANARNAHVVRWEDCEIETEGPDGPIRQRVILPDLPDALAKTVGVFSDYYHATEKARRGRRDIEWMTWEQTALGICQAIESSGIMTGRGASPRLDDSALPRPTF